MMVRGVQAGTGTAAQIPGLRIGGKTGTAETGIDGRNTTWFIAFAPVENPRIAMAIIVENGGFGARAAAPIARAVLDYFMLGKVPPAMKQAPEDDAADKQQSD